MMNTFAWISRELAELENQRLLRRIEILPGASAIFERGAGKILNLAGNDYLGLGSARSLVDSAAAAAFRYGSGAGSSRLLCGSFELHHRLEERLAEFLGVEAALVCGSGYLANLSAVQSLVGRNDSAVSDRFVHASLIDGVRLSRAKHFRFRHNDPESLSAVLLRLRPKRKVRERVLILTESLFSMDGDIAPLEALGNVALEHDAMLLIDEAHAIGIYGKGGRGLAEDSGSAEGAIVKTGSFGKSFASYGGFVAGREEVKELLVNKGRGFIYNTGLAPACAGAAMNALDEFADDSRREKLFANAGFMRKSLRESGIVSGLGDSPIIPIPVPENDRCMKFKERLLERGVLAAAIRSPTVPVGQERLRISISAAHSSADLDFALGVIREVAEELGVLR